MEPFTVEALAEEINVDPLGIGYKNPDGTWKADGEIVALLNAKGFNVNRERVSTADVRAATTFDAFDGLTASEEAYMRWVCMGESIAVTADILATFAGVGGQSIWATGERALMEARMAALMIYQGSRAESLWGEGFLIAAGMVGAAANV